MTSNLWNIQQPIKRIDFFYKIDEHKRHLIRLQQIKSSLKTRQNFHNYSYTQQFFKVNNLNIQQKNIDEKNLRSQRIYNVDKMIHQKFKSDDQNEIYHSMNNSLLNTTRSYPTKFIKQKKRQIDQYNKKVFKTIQSIKPSPDLSLQKLNKKYSEFDLKYKINLQKTKYKNIDFTKQAQKLLKGGKIKFQRKNNNYNQNNEKNRKKYVELDWKLQKKQIQQVR